MTKHTKYFLYLRRWLIPMAITGWLIFNMIDEELEIGFHEFFHEDKINIKENGFIALVGIDAPKNVDIFEYGEKVLAETKKEGNHISKENEINFINKINLNCWIVQGKGQTKQDKELCADKDTLIRLLQKNKLLLERYASLRDYEHFVSYLFGWENEQLIIQLNELFLAKLALLISQDEPEKALKEWLQDTMFWQKVMTEQQELVGKAIIMIIYSQNIEFLPVIISSSPKLVEQYESQLFKVLNVPAFGQGGLNIASTMRAEYEILKILDRIYVQDKSLKSKIFYKSNATKNKFYAFAKDMVWLSKQLPAESELIKQEIKEKYNLLPIWQKLIYNNIGNLALDGMFIGGAEIISVRHHYIAYLRMLDLYIEAKSKEIPSSNMKSFISNIEKKYWNPVTEKPFKWNSKSESIYFIIPNYDGFRREIFY